jgi:hypothetical protein
MFIAGRGTLRDSAPDAIAPRRRARIGRFFFFGAARALRASRWPASSIELPHP